MSTAAFQEKPQNRVKRVRDLRWILGSLTFMALAEAFRSLKYFYLGSYHRSMLFEVLKVGLVLIASVLAWKHDQPGQQGRPESPGSKDWYRGDVH